MSIIFNHEAEVEAYNSGFNCSYHDNFPFLNQEAEASKKLFKCFFRGYFESKANITLANDNPRIMITIPFRGDASELKNILEAGYAEPSFKTEIFIAYTEIQALELLHDIYKNSTPDTRLEDKYDIYTSLLLGKNQTVPKCRFIKASKDAVVPFKNRVTDVGYDLTIVSKVKSYGKLTVMYDTGIKVRPPLGYYTKIVPRSSLIKSGYMLTNSVGIIDTGFSDTLKICLTKIDNSLPDLKLPFTCCQLIMEKLIHYEFEENDTSDFEISSRGLGGFGSTDK